MTNMQGRRRRGARVWSPQGVPTKRSSPPPSPSGSMSPSGPMSPSGHADKFAGSKWGEPPSATELPRPPMHWTSRLSEPERLDRSLALKMLLQVA